MKRIINELISAGNGVEPKLDETSTSANSDQTLVDGTAKPEQEK